MDKLFDCSEIEDGRERLVEGLRDAVCDHCDGTKGCNLGQDLTHRKKCLVEIYKLVESFAKKLESKP